MLTCALQVLQGLESATNCVDDMDEWLNVFNVKLRHMREDIASVRDFVPLKLCVFLFSILNHKTATSCSICVYRAVLCSLLICYGDIRVYMVITVSRWYLAHGLN